MTCAYCKRELSVEERENPYQGAKGWVRKRDAGGTNHVVGIRLVPETFACVECVHKLKRGVAPSQASLL